MERGSSLRLGWWTVLCLFAGGCGGESVVERPSGPPAGHAWVIFANDTLVVEVADTPELQGQGLAGRDAAGVGSGMLFVWDEPRVRSFWMDETYVPLDLTFLDYDFRVLSITPLQPESQDLVSSAQPVAMAIETPSGVLDRVGVRVGSVLEILLSSEGSVEPPA